MNDLSRFSEPESPMPTFGHLRDLQAYYHSRGYHYSNNGDGSRRQALDVLDQLVGQCEHLTPLHIAMLAPKEEQVPRSHEDRQYVSCARFLDSVRQTLRTFTYEQGFSYDKHAAEECWSDGWGETPVFPRPMDRMLAQHVSPILLEAPWPRMKTMKLVGVGETERECSGKVPPWEDGPSTKDIVYEDLDAGTWGEEPSYCWDTIVTAYPSAEDMRTQLTQVLLNATVVVKEPQDQDFESFMEDGYGIQNTSRWRR
jgi:hypothetical protein